MRTFFTGHYYASNDSYDGALGLIAENGADLYIL